MESFSVKSVNLTTLNDGVVRRFIWSGADTPGSMRPTNSR